MAKQDSSWIWWVAGLAGLWLLSNNNAPAPPAPANSITSADALAAARTAAQSDAGATVYEAPRDDYSYGPTTAIQAASTDIDIYGGEPKDAVDHGSPAEGTSGGIRSFPREPL